MKIRTIVHALFFTTTIGLSLWWVSCADQGSTETIFVDMEMQNSSDRNIGSENAPLQTIQEAANRAIPGTTIYIKGGVYNEMIRIRKSGTANAMIVIKPYNNEHVVINTPSYACFDLQNVEYIEISGFELTGATHNRVAHAGAIRAAPTRQEKEEFGCRNCIFSNNIIHDNDAGIWLLCSKNNLISNNIIHRSGEAPIRLKHSPGNEVFNNLCYHNGSKEPWGICYYGSPHTIIHHNTIVERNSGAIYIYEGTSNLAGVRPGTLNFCIPCSNCQVYDNICVVYQRGAPLVIGSSTTTDRDPILDRLYGPLNNYYEYNLFYHQTDPRTIVSWGDFGEPRHILLSLPEFQAKYPGYGLFSMSTDPLFVDTEHEDFRLKEESPAKGAASDGSDLGVNFAELPRY